MKGVLVIVKFLGGGKSELWISDIDGTHQAKLAASGGLVTGNWSPDSTQLTFVDGGNKAYVVRADGHRLRQIERVEGEIGYIAWSADGKSLPQHHSRPKKNNCLEIQRRRF